ncbi:MAG: stage II sporulation protein R [Firmicutes bacterium]|nr:stage II sporulation protein R [Bacillota bacterium]
MNKYNQNQSRHNQTEQTDFKKALSYGLVALILGAIVFLAFSGGINAGVRASHTEYLRIHIRANSNSAPDQAVKYEVRDRVSDFLTPRLVEAVTKQRAMYVVKDALPQIKSLVNRHLAQRGFVYTATASIKNAYFPTRNYLDFVLRAGYYDALIIILGNGQGDNWWCVVYPPLCFIGSDNGTNNIRYRSFLLDIINDFRRRS